ncbi:hypothetical protein ANN_04316 [Periplaneta americana]|uniref:Uncharacterized protein n=1 Tax=Periplaneta americana TaxID=6978 RepID=A0ABQ8TAM7_PERAM|nr:hypothetical protein ANN_04316 [Periplaneta americana]
MHEPDTGIQKKNSEQPCTDTTYSVTRSYSRTVSPVPPIPQHLAGGSDLDMPVLELNEDGNGEHEIRDLYELISSGESELNEMLMAWAVFKKRKEALAYSDKKHKAGKTPCLGLDLVIFRLKQKKHDVEEPSSSVLQHNHTCINCNMWPIRRKGKNAMSNFEGELQEQSITRTFFIICYTDRLWLTFRQEISRRSARTAEGSVRDITFIMQNTWNESLVPQLASQRRYRDDQVIFSNTEDELQVAAHKLNELASEYNMSISEKKTKAMAFEGAHCRRLSGLNNRTVIGELRERLSVAKRVEQQVNISKFNILKLKYEETKQHYLVEISNRFATLGSSDKVEKELDVNSLWENTRDNIKIAAEQSIGYYETKKKKSWFDEDCCMK